MTRQLRATQQKLSDAETSIRLLRKFKHAYKKAAELKCSGCSKSYQPLFFKTHVVSCPQILREEELENQLASEASELDLLVKKIDTN